MGIASKEPRITVEGCSQVVDGGGNGRLEWIEVEDTSTGGRTRRETGGLFLLLGAIAHCDWLPSDVQEFLDDQTVSGRVRRIAGDTVWVDVGYKSEGAIELREWYDDALDSVIAPAVGDEVEVIR